MDREEAETQGLQPMAKFLGFAVGGVPPEVMGIGPIVAVPKALKIAGLTQDRYRSYGKSMKHLLLNRFKSFVILVSIWIK